MSKDKLYDLVAAAPLILWLGVGAAGFYLRIAQLHEWRDFTIQVFVQISNIFFLLLAITLLVIRRPAIGKTKGFGPRLAGFVGCVTPFFLLALPRRALYYPLSEFLSLAGFVGSVASIYVLFWLGRSFSILPQARGLVTDGPYRFVRHPLYLAEFLIIFSRVSELAQPWPFFIIALALGSQIARMHYEEQILCEMFPDYRDYMSHTARLFPRIY